MHRRGRVWEMLLREDEDGDSLGTHNYSMGPVSFRRRWGSNLSKQAKSELVRVSSFIISLAVGILADAIQAVS